MESEEFKDLSIRARVAYGICCLESAINYYNINHFDWTFILDVLWSYTNGNIGKWHEIMAECSPDSILEDLSYEVKGITIISIEEYEKLRTLFMQSNKVCQDIINIIFNIGTRDLYSSIVNGSPDTLKYLQQIIEIMKHNNIPLPDVEYFRKYSIHDNEGWGKEFSREDIYK